MNHFYIWYKTARNYVNAIAFYGLFLMVILAASLPGFANSFVVNNNGDFAAVNLVTGEGAPGQICLRSAVQAATATAGSHTISFSITGTINLTLGQITLGNAANGNNITISGPGMDLLTVNQTTENRVFSTGTGAVTVSLQNITLNYTGPSVTAYSGGGGAIIAGGAGAATTLLNCRISNFQRQLGNGGAISASSSLNNHSLTITNCIFINNRAGGAGGAVSFNSQGGTATITGCTFSNNHTGPVGANTGGDGGAISVTGGGSGGTYLVEKNTFLNNQVENVTGHAGAVMNTNGTLTLRFNRFIGNTCANVSFPPLANIVGQAGGATTHVTIADNNWWGVNTGPGANDATALAAGAVMTLTKWLQLKTTASPNPICASSPSNLGHTSTVTTSFLSNSASEAIAVGNLPVLIGLPVTWSSTLGSLSGQQTTIQANGTATATFTSNGTGGNATVNTQVDNVPVNDPTARATIVVNTLSVAPTGATGTTTICNGATATLTVSGGSKGTAAVTQWYTGSCGTTLAFTGDAFTTPALTSDQTYYVRFSGTCNTTTCATVVVTVLPAVSYGSMNDAGTGTVCSGTIPASMSATGGTGGSGVFTYQWYKKSAAACPSGTDISGWTALTIADGTGFNTTTFTPTAAVTSDVTYALLVIPGGVPTCGTPTWTTGCRVVIVNNVTGGTVDGTQTICSGADPAAFTESVVSTGDGALTYQWQKSTTDCSTGFSNIDGATGTTYDPPAGLINTTYYRRITKSTLSAIPCTANSNCITVTINNVTGGSITSGVAVVVDQTICSGGDPGYFYNAPGGESTGSGALTYQWQSNTTSCGGAFSDIGGATGITFNPPAGLTITTYYRRVTKSTLNGVECTATSNCITVFVKAPPLVSAPTVTQPTCGVPLGTIAVNATGDGTLEYQLNGGIWQLSNSFGLLSPANYNIAVRLQSLPGCATSYSGNPVVLNAPTGCGGCNVTGGTVAGSQPICTGGDPAGFTESVASTGDGTLSYQWQSSTADCSTGFSDIGGATGTTYDPPSGLTVTTYYRRVTKSTLGAVECTQNSNCITVSVKTPPLISAPTVTQPTCALPVGAIVINATGDGTLEYQLNGGTWQLSNSFGPLAPTNYNIAVRLQSLPGCATSYSGNPVVLNAPSGCGDCGPVTTRLYVNTLAPVGGAGSAWSCAMRELSDAVAYANTHPTVTSIWVAQGTYKPTTTADRAASMIINRANLQIIGGFAGIEADASLANPAIYPTIISGDIGAPGTGDNSYHLLKIFNVPANANSLVISGFILAQGNANVAGSGNNYGGAALVYNVNAGATVRFMQCLFGQNNAVQGGAIYFDHASAQFERCIFGLNTATTFGGAVFGFFSSSKFEQTMFSQNVAGNSGGAYYSNYGLTEFNKVAFSGNTATGGGGGVYQNGANCNYYNTVFENNSAGLGGGIVAYNGSMSKIVNSTFFSNMATTWGGGALYLGTNNSQADVQNSIFWKNRKAGLDNVATADVVWSTGSNVFRNNILQANTAVPADNGVNITNNQRGVNPLFTNEADPDGGDFLFGTADDGLQLQAGSPAIDAGNNTATTSAGLTQDLRNNPRIVCTIVDMGAYENQDCIPVVITQNSIQFEKAELGSTAIVTNPFSHELQIRYTGNEKCSAVVYSSTGTTAWQSVKLAPGVTRIATSSWGTGMYQVVLRTGSGKQLTYKALKF